MFKRRKTLLLPVAILAATLGVAPNAAAVLSETRVGGYHFVDAASRLAAPSQVPESQQASGLSWYDTASECSDAAKSTVQEGTTVYRVWGGKSGPWGESWTTVNPNTVPNLRSAAGLPDVNTGRFVSEGVLQSTEGVTSRGALIIKPGQQGNLPELVIKNAEQQIKLRNVSGVNPEF
jgi:hypothetical protein